MFHDYEIKELLAITYELLIKATVTGKEFHKSLQRFLTHDERKEVEDMIRLRAEDYGFEPNVTGFEESNNLAFLDGVNEANLKTARNLVDLGCDDDFIVKATELDLETVQKLRK